MARKKKNKSNKFMRWLATVAVGVALAAVGVNTNHISTPFNNEVASSSTYNKKDYTPTEEQASVVLTDNVRQQLGGNLSFNGAGAFIVNNNKTNLNTKVSSVPYAVNEVDSLNRPTVANAWLKELVVNIKIAKLQEMDVQVGSHKDLGRYKICLVDSSMLMIEDIY